MDAKDDSQRHDWTGVGALSLGWALSFSVVTASITASNLAGRQFSPGAAFNTVPLAVLLISLSAWSFALPRLFEAFGGRLSVYRITSAVGMVASVVAAVACASRSFAALCIASAMFGLPSAAGQTFRFAALSMVPKSSHPKCIGAVLTGGIVGALVGPSYAAGSTDLFPDAKYAGVYLCTGVAFLGILIIMLIPGLVTFHAEHDTDEEDRDDARADAPPDSKPKPPSAVSAAFARPNAVAAVIVSALSYAAMSFLMSPTPLAMRALGYSLPRVSHVIMTHMVGMYAPSFFTGAAVARFGFASVSVAGVAVIAASSGIMRSGTSFAHFICGQGLLGVGWNLCFVASTSEVAKTSLEVTAAAGGSASERAAGARQVQSASDAATFAAAGIASISSGAALADLGWNGMQTVGWSASAAAAAAVLVAAAAERSFGTDDDADDVADATKPEAASADAGDDRV